MSLCRIMRVGVDAEPPVLEPQMDTAAAPMDSAD